ncbi:hypothetical protein BD770DRAFT_397051 [Pilaira anomala]|nr:hypothetical protein BD770DRAFT_397051 [Pilaira anomala]
MEGTFWLLCEEPDHCHCDWRISIINCYESKPMFYIYTVNIVWSLLIAIMGSGIIYDRVIRKKLPIFDFESSVGNFIRPRPIESLVFFGTIFNFFRALDTILLVSDALPNSIVRSILYELPWQFGLCAFACYLFGIAHTVSHSSKIIRNNWFRSSIRIDILCTTLITLPFITNNICSIAASIYADRSQFYQAKLFTDLLYHFWSFYCFILASFILFAGLRLLKILQHHLENQHDQDNHASHKIKHGAFKVKVVMVVSVTSLLVFMLIKCFYGIFRKEILLNHVASLFVAIFWTFDGTVASTVVFLTLVINPKALSQLNISSNSNGSETYTNTQVLSTSHNNQQTPVVDSDYLQREYQLNNLSASNEISKGKYNPFIVSSEFEQSTISETHLVTEESKRYKL